MKPFIKFVRYAGIYALLFFFSACSEKPATESVRSPVEQSGVELTLSVYKSPTCRCCGKWIDHVEAAGFKTSVHHPASMDQIKADNGIVSAYQSCHTAISNEGYVFEGHIPAKYIQQFLDSPPDDAAGLAVPAMPVGSPGMEMGDRFSPYQVLLLKKDGSSEIFAQVETPEDQY